MPSCLLNFLKCPCLFFLLSFYFFSSFLFLLLRFCYNRKHFSFCLVFFFSSSSWVSYHCRFCVSFFSSSSSSFSLFFFHCEYCLDFLFLFLYLLFLCSSATISASSSSSSSFSSARSFVFNPSGCLCTIWSPLIFFLLTFGRLHRRRIHNSLSSSATFILAIPVISGRHSSDHSGISGWFPDYPALFGHYSATVRLSSVVLGRCPLFHHFLPIPTWPFLSGPFGHFCLSNQMTHHLIGHTATSRRGNSRRAEFSTTSHLVWANSSWATFGMLERRRMLGEIWKRFSPQAPQPESSNSDRSWAICDNATCRWLITPPR